MRYFGFFEFLKPIIIITDADLVKEIGIRNFNNFVNRREVNFDVLDRDFFCLLPFLISKYNRFLLLTTSHNVVIIEERNFPDDNWRKVRAQSDAAYTKAKCLDFYPILMEHVDFMMKYFEKLFHEEIGVDGILIYCGRFFRNLNLTINFIIIHFTFEFYYSR